MGSSGKLPGERPDRSVLLDVAASEPHLADPLVGGGGDAALPGEAGQRLGADADDEASGVRVEPNVAVGGRTCGRPSRFGAQTLPLGPISLFRGLDLFGPPLLTERDDRRAVQGWCLLGEAVAPFDVAVVGGSLDDVLGTTDEGLRLGVGDPQGLHTAVMPEPLRPQNSAEAQIARLASGERG